MTHQPRSIELDTVGVIREGRRVLRDVTISLSARTIAVIGANGSGKSTFARLLNGLLTATTGSVRVHGLDPDRDGRRVRERVGLILSNPAAQIIMPTVREDVEFSLRGRRLGREEIAQRVDGALARVGLSGYRDSSAYQLSGGQQQLLALAAVLVTRPELIIADEPTALLDLGNARKISRLLLDEADAQVVLVTHDLRLAAACDTVICFADGRLVASGDPGHVIGEYERSYA